MMDTPKRAADLPFTPQEFLDRVVEGKTRDAPYKLRLSFTPAVQTDDITMTDVFSCHATDHVVRVSFFRTPGQPGITKVFPLAHILEMTLIQENVDG